MKINGYDIRYVRATAKLEAEKISLGAVLDVRRNGKRVQIMRPTRGYFPSLDPSLGPVGRYFEGQATSEVALRAGLRRDLWTAVQPDIDPLLPLVRLADKRFADAGPDVQALLIAAITDRYTRHPPPATFRVIASPMVSWIWLGAMVVVLGALIALWPAPLLARRRVEAAAGAARSAASPSRA
jgi:cytochrome c-type biogenesis protein CcmF